MWDNIQVSALFMSKTFVLLCISSLFLSSVYATCVNSQGPSKPGNTLENVQTRGQVPIAPLNPADFVHPSNTSVRLDLFTWSKESCPVDYFIVSYRKEKVSPWSSYEMSNEFFHEHVLQFRICIGRSCLTISD